MSVSAMKKLTVFAFRADVDHILRKLMSLRCVEVRESDRSGELLAVRRADADTEIAACTAKLNLLGEALPLMREYGSLGKGVREYEPKSFEREKQRDKIRTIQQEMKNYDNFSVEHLNDIAYQMKNRKKLKRTHMTVLTLGIITEIIEAGTLVLGFMKGIWWPYLIGLVVIIAIAAYAIFFYHRNVAYICPECHKVFRPNMREFFFASHTPATRKLKCTECGHHGFCVETYQPIKTYSTNRF